VEGAALASTATQSRVVGVVPLFRRVLGADFDRLHPRLRQQYGFTSADGTCFAGEGVMDEVWRGPFFYVPFLMVGATRRAMFPETGRDVPFTIRNYAYTDGLGRETLTWTREFRMPRARRFDETMVYAPERGCIVVYVGTHQHLAVELFIEAGKDGELLFRTGAQRMYEGRVAFKFPLLLSGSALVTERVNDAEERFEVDVAIRNRMLGGIFGYRGWFRGGVRACAAADVPRDVRPAREERRV
jgi:Domain of unknown function (DUF4166)